MHDRRKSRAMNLRDDYGRPPGPYKNQARPGKGRQEGYVLPET